MCYNEIGLRAQSLNTILGSIIKDNWEGLEREISFRTPKTSTVELISKTWNDNIWDSQLLTIWDNFITQANKQTKFCFS